MFMSSYLLIPKSVQLSSFRASVAKESGGASSITVAWRLCFPVFEKELHFVLLLKKKSFRERL